MMSMQWIDEDSGARCDTPRGRYEIEDAGRVFKVFFDGETIGILDSMGEAKKRCAKHSEAMEERDDE